MSGCLALDKEIDEIRLRNDKPSLLLHCCCAPCATYVTQYLVSHFDITALFYNPNIDTKDEHDKRATELLKLPGIHTVGDSTGSVETIICEYDGKAFDEIKKAYPDEPEGGRRCELCYKLRLGETGKLARAEGFDYFATTLSVSPHKSAALLNDIGKDIEMSYGVRYLPGDFKKRDGYKRSVELSKLYGLYRQAYCGCTPQKG